MSELNPIEAIFDLHPDDAAEWLWKRVRETGAHEAERWFWNRLSEAMERSTREAQLMERQGMDGKVGSEA